jgi:hypothetical protein
MYKTKKYRKPLLIGLILAAIAAISAGGYYLWKKFKKPKGKGDGRNPGPGGGAHLPRSIRNHNALNLKISENAWKGKIPISQNTDGVFEQFETAELGMRAGMYNMRTWIRRGKNTLKTLILTLGPDVQQPYIDYVSQKTGIGESTALSEDNIPSIARHMAHMEAGYDYPNDNWEAVFATI